MAGLVIVIAGWLWGCSLVAPKFVRPQLSLASIELQGGNLLQQNFLVKLNIQNPNDRALPVTGVHVELRVAGESVATGVSTRPFIVPAQGDTQFDMKINANMALVLLKLAGRRDGMPESLDYSMTGGASIDLPFLHDVKFQQNGSFPLNGLR